MRQRLKGGIGGCHGEDKGSGGYDCRVSWLLGCERSVRAGVVGGLQDQDVKLLFRGAQVQYSNSVMDAVEAEAA